jgi:hypothetical protein
MYLEERAQQRGVLLLAERERHRARILLQSETRR